MNGQMTLVIYVVVMAAIITGVDFAFLQGRFWLRLIVNIAIVLVFLAGYWKFLR
jgi:hypothetical protein